MKSELITPYHLANKAIIYVRQSTPHQTLSNQESLELQYALKQKALDLGWTPNHIETIDTDLGLTGASADHREGFKDILTRVAFGHVGIILSYDVTRLSRNCSDWYPLLDLCGYKNCLIGDRDGVYDPGTMNGRLLLGLKGQLAEMELSTIRARLTAGLLNKAKRGDLALQLPVGLVRNTYNQVQKEPNLEIQQRIQLIFDTFLRVKTASKTLHYFNQHELRLPRYDRFRELSWRKPTISAIITTLKNPAYAGAFVYGRTRVIREGATKTEVTLKKVPQEEWKVIVKDKYPAYISWDVFEQIQAMLKENYSEYDRNKTRGVPRPGEALLHGIVYCGECGRKMVVEYKKGTYYICNGLRQQYGTPLCQRIPGNPVDQEVVQLFFQALSPLELDAYTHVISLQTEIDASVQKAHQQQLERLRYQAKLAERQFNQVDPDNRLVASELEKRWEHTLHELKQAEASFTTTYTQKPTELPLSEEFKSLFMNIGQNLPTLWQQGEIISQKQKKEFLRSLIDKIVTHRSTRDNVQTRIVWKGGATTTINIPVKVGSLSHLSFAQEMENKIIELSKAGKSDEEIAHILAESGFRSPMGQNIFVATIKSIRLRHGIFYNRSQSHPRRIKGFLTITQISKLIDVLPHWIYDRINNGTINMTLTHLPHYKRGIYLFPDTQETMDIFKKIKNKNF
jgi:DNA invertase Pin-like site-specific DNA recombinase